MNLKSQGKVGMSMMAHDSRKKNDVVMTREEALKKKLPKGYAYEPIAHPSGVPKLPVEAVGESDGRKKRLGMSTSRKSESVSVPPLESSRDMCDQSRTGGGTSSKRKSMNLNVELSKDGRGNGGSTMQQEAMDLPYHEQKRLRRILHSCLDDAKRWGLILLEREAVLTSEIHGDRSDSAGNSRKRTRRNENGTVEMSSAGQALHADGGFGETAQSGTPIGASARVSRQMSLQVSDTSAGGKDKRTPKANSAYINSDFFSGKDKMPPPEKFKPKSAATKKVSGKVGDGRDLHRQRVEAARAKRMSDMMKMCMTLLRKLLSHKYAWVFDKPVDVENLGLHDYFKVIKRPMDLGSVNRKLTAGDYPTPQEYHEDVQLVWSNAMRYNGEGTDVYVMAEDLKKIFEEGYRRIQARMNEDLDRRRIEDSMEESKENSEVLELEKRLQKLESQVGAGSGIGKSRAKGLATKPKNKDAGKRDMTFEEKQKLSINLGNVPGDKLEEILQIISKRNPGLSQNAEEIELDIDSLDKDTLWELDRFVATFMKGKSKTRKRQDEVAQTVPKKISAPSASVRKRAKGEGEDSIDIEDEGPTAPIAAVSVEKDVARSESSGTSGSSDDSSSSSESDSGSGSSVSDSDADDAQSKDAGSKASAKKEPSGSHGASRQEGSPSPKADGTHNGVKVDSLKDREDGLRKQSSLSEVVKSEDPVDKEPKTGPTLDEVGVGSSSLSDDASMRAALLHGKYADIILNAQRKAISSEIHTSDPKKMKELEKRQKEDRARLESEARAAQEAKRKKEQQEVEELRKLREAEREAERQRLQEMERTVEIDENHKVLKDLRRLGGVRTPVNMPGIDSATNTPLTVPAVGTAIVGLDMSMASANVLGQFGLVMREEDDEEGLTHDDEDGSDDVDDAMGGGERVADDVEEGEI